jgi:hypothetical protein
MFVTENAFATRWEMKIPFEVLYSSDKEETEAALAVDHS